MGYDGCRPRGSATPKAGSSAALLRRRRRRRRRRRHPRRRYRPQSRRRRPPLRSRRRQAPPPPPPPPPRLRISSWSSRQRTLPATRASIKHRPAATARASRWITGTRSSVRTIRRRRPRSPMRNTRPRCLSSAARIHTASGRIVQWPVPRRASGLLPEMCGPARGAYMWLGTLGGRGRGGGGRRGGGGGRGGCGAGHAVPVLRQDADKA